jgi:hypothetical protein
MTLEGLFDAYRPNPGENGLRKRHDNVMLTHALSRKAIVRLRPAGHGRDAMSSLTCGAVISMTARDHQVERHWSDDTALA